MHTFKSNELINKIFQNNMSLLCKQKQMSNNNSFYSMIKPSKAVLLRPLFFQI